MIIGLIGGLLGALFNMLNMKLAKFRKMYARRVKLNPTIHHTQCVTCLNFSYIRSRRQKFLEAIFVAAASAFTGFITIFFVNDCQPTGVNPHLTEYTKLWCD